MRRHSHPAPLARAIFTLAFALVFFSLAAPSLSAAGCPILHHPAPSEADTALRAGDYARAVDLYRAALAKSPGETPSILGLVHSLLAQGKLQEATAAIPTEPGDKPMAAALMTLRAEVELRKGEPWTAAETASASAKLDPCNPRTVLLIARLAGLTSRYGTERKMLLNAHQLDPDDAEIRAAWISNLAPAQRIPEIEAYLANSPGESEASLHAMQTELDQLKKWAEQPHKPCTLASPTVNAEIPFSNLRTFRGQTTYSALDVIVNNHRSRLSIDTSYNPRLPIDGVSGLLILRSVAEHMGLKPLFQNEIPGVGGHQGPRSGYVAYADTISVGGVEFHDCAVQVMDGAYWSDADGSMSTSLFSDFLVTLDYPSQKLILGPLPVRPGDTPATGPESRYIAPEMKDYTAVYRAGTDLIFPASINQKAPMLLLLDTAVGSSALSPAAAHQVVEGHRDSKYEVRDKNGAVDTNYTAGNVTLSFAHLNQNVGHIPSFDTLMFTSDTDMEVSGLIGDGTLKGLTIHIDYRDGLVKLDFDPKRAGAFSH